MTTKNQPFLIRLRFALHGLLYGLRLERSLRFQAAAFVLVLILLIVLRPPALWWALVLLSSSAVIAAELLNTTLEHLIDHLHPGVHEQIRRVKDCAAAAVLVTVLGAIAVGIALAVHLLSHI
ncbi:MAG TPA: diacylglycerol kinase [Steroidobacteraceae bacterium]|nr:diacylglycerol kinase [Steroidobacteraceae bacterium]